VGSDFFSFCKTSKQKPMRISKNSSKEAIQGGDTKDKDEEITKIKESRDDKIVL
jgi:hypothetical protein